jgi:hypothetical protein
VEHIPLKRIPMANGDDVRRFQQPLANSRLFRRFAQRGSYRVFSNSRPATSLNGVHKPAGQRLESGTGVVFAGDENDMAEIIQKHRIRRMPEMYAAHSQTECAVIGIYVRPSDNEKQDLAATPAVNEGTDSLGSGGTLGLLGPAVYEFTGSVTNLIGTLTLAGDGNSNDLWIFEIATAFTTASDSSVVVTATGADAGVYFEVGSQATFGVDGTIQGNVLAGTAIVFQPGAQITCGRAFAQSAVNFDGVDTSNGVETNCSVKYSVDVEKYNRSFHLIQLHTPRGVSDECTEIDTNAIVLTKRNAAKG